MNIYRYRVTFLPLILLVISFVLPLQFNSSQARSDTLGPCHRPYDRQVTSPYMIHATWMYNRGSACAWQKALEQFHRIGGKVVIQFGQPLKKLQRAGNRLYLNEGNTRKQVLLKCRDQGSSCVSQTINDFRQAGIDPNRIRNWLIYSSEDQFTNKILCRDSSLDKKITKRGWGKPVIYWRIILPHGKNQKTCDYRNGQFDVLFVKNIPGKFNETKALLSVANALNMKVFLGAPSFPPLTNRAWVVDRHLQSATMDWSRRVFEDYAHQYQQYRSYAGIYQSFEVALQPGWEGKEHKIYQEQANRYHHSNPDKKYMISPYFMVNKSMYGATLKGTVKGFKLLARAGIDIIIPQDGRGTGKAALYWPWQKYSSVRQVDPQLANYNNVKSHQSFASQFYASTFELYKAIKQAQQQLKKKEGIQVELWANIEAFEEDKKNSTYRGCAYSSLSQTNKKRLDRAITFSAGMKKIASFMYDPLFTCKDRYGVSLLDQIKSDYDRPVITQANITSGRSSYLLLKGYYLGTPGTQFRISWKDHSGIIRHTLAKVFKRGKSIQGLQSLYLRLNNIVPQQNSILRIRAINHDGRHSHESYGLQI